MMNRRSAIKALGGGAVAAYTIGTTGAASAAASCPSSSTADVVLSGAVDYPQGFTVPVGQVWEFDPTADTTVRSGGNIIVHGTLRAVPGPNHRITFYGINEAAIVGGGMAPLVTDVGLWVDGGVLDISGVPKDAWNRTGSHPTWSATDELLIAPTDPGDYLCRPFAPGDPVPTVSTPTLHAGTSYEVTNTYVAEVFNMTRSFVIEAEGGRAHVIIINVDQPQRLEYVEFRNLGPTGKLGRYPLHVHMNGDGTEGSLFRGNVAKNCGNHAFVPHLSNGCDMSYSIAYRTVEQAFWWDTDDESERVNWDRCAAVETKHSGFLLGEGIGNSCVSSVAVGTVANGSNAGVLWPSQANGDRNAWLVEGTVAHNNNSQGFRAWQNDRNPHVIARCIAYRNNGAGFGHGAYNNRYRYFQCVAFDNVGGDMVAHALGEWSASNNWVGVFRLVRHSQPPIGVNVIESSPSWPILRVEMDEAAPGDGPANGGTFRFVSSNIRCDLEPADIVATGVQLSTIEVVNKSKSSFTLAP